MSPTDEPEEEREEGHLGGLVRHSAIYSAAPVLRQLISIGMTHLYTRWLGGANFGVKGVIDLWMIGLQQLLGVNILGAMVRFYYDQKSSRDRASVVTSCTLLVTLVAWVVCGTAFFFSSALQPLMLPDAGEVVARDLVVILQLMLVLIPFQLSTQSGFYYLMAIKRSSLYTTIQTGKLLVEVGLNFFLMGHLGWGVEGFMVSMLVGEALTSLLLCGWIIKNLGARIEWRILRPILAYAAPLVPVGICQLALHSMDRRLLVEFTDTDRAWAVTGIYDLGYKIGFLVTTMVLGPFIQIFHPWIYDITDPELRSKHLARVGTWAVMAVAAATLGVTLFGRQAAVVLGGTREFWEAWRVIPFVACGYVFWALYHVSQIPLFIAKRPGRLFVINLMALGINLGANAWLIPRYEFVGAGIATAVTFASLAVLGVLASRSEAHVPFEVGRLTAILSAVLLGGALALWVDTHNVAGDLSTIAAVSVKALGCLILVGVLWRSILDGEERGRLAGWLAGLRRAG